MSRHDPADKKFYSALRNAEKVESLLFWISAPLSILVLILDRQYNSNIYDFAQATFVLSVLLYFAATSSIKMYWSSRAHEERLSGFLSSAFSLPLTEDVPSEYYNNAAKPPYKKLAFQLLENLLFSKHILLSMLVSARIKTCIYILIWLIAALYRATDLAAVVAVAQIVFGEQVASRWLRMEWLRSRLERLYKTSYDMLTSSEGTTALQFQARILHQFAMYETCKAQAGISMSSAVFHRDNAKLSAEWERIKKTIQPPA